MRFLTSALTYGCLSSALSLASPLLQQQQPFLPSSASPSPLTLETVQARLGLPTLSDLSSTLSRTDYAQLLHHLSSLPEQRWVSFSEDPADRVLITEGQKALLVYAGVRFIDVTDEVAGLTAERASFSPKEDWPKKYTYGVKELEDRLFSHIDKERMLGYLKKFTNFRTRYYRSETGKQSQKWLLDTVKEIASHDTSLNITVNEFPHAWGQNSIIARFPSRKSKGSVIIGAHQDSTNLLPFLSAPGADDDASGTVTLLEVLNLLVKDGYSPLSYDVELHWYSAEEGGMLGSQPLAASYDPANVRAMLQMDMTAYVKPNTKERIGIIEDFVSPSLTEWIHDLIDEYLTIPSVRTKCGYACSDHSSWTKVGVPSAFAIEATFEDSNTRNIHTSGDTINVDGYSLDHMKQFVRLSSSFLLELAA